MIWLHGKSNEMTHDPSSNLLHFYAMILDCKEANILNRIELVTRPALDQVLALKWVQEHIRSFGGDPQEVTIFGMSAGGASVDYLTLSPLTRGLYKNSVALSGSALCWWASVPHPRNQALSLAEYFKCPTDQGGRAMVDCLKKVHGNKLMAAQKHLFFEWEALQVLCSWLLGSQKAEFNSRQIY